MKEYLIKNKKKFFGVAFIILPVCAFYLTIGCPIRFFTGISCPGCGMSRALLALLSFDFEKAFIMHPLIFIMPVVGLVYVFRKHIPKKLLNFLIILFFISMLITYFCRMFQGSEVVYFAPQTGAFYRLYDFLGGILNAQN